VDRGNNMAKMKRKQVGPQPPSALLSSFMYHIVLSLAALVGVTAYTAGAGLEGSLLRSAMVLLVSITIGYAANIGLWLVETGRIQVGSASPTGTGAWTGREIEVEARKLGVVPSQGESGMVVEGQAA
jgi:hypothetical protein